jgi:arylsulfatase A-like enzyme
MRPNILWIVFDTARADALEPYGAPAGSTPALRALADRGVAAGDVHSTACWTLPSHFSMFGGGLPRQLGLANQAGITPDSTRPVVEALSDRWLPEVLRRAGYRTAGVSANAWVTSHSGFGTGFDRFLDVRSGRQAKMSAADRRARAAWVAETVRARVDDGARRAAAELGEWSTALTQDPFFWFVNLVECHSPYLPPKPYTDLSVLARAQAAREASRHLTMEAFWRACVTGDLPDAAALGRMRTGYRSAIRYMDAWLEQLLASLDSSGVLENTLVIVSSDHGENFGEGGLIGHGFSLDERLLRVPLIAAGPCAESLETVRSLVEVPARLADIAEVEDHPYDADDLPPLPVAQFDPPVPPRGDAQTSYFADRWELDEAAIARLTMSMTAVIEGSVKMIVRDGEELFHDLVADPLELSPVHAEHVDPQVVARLRAAAAHPSVTARDVDLVATTPAAAPAPGDVADLEERMRLLGYL